MGDVPPADDREQRLIEAVVSLAKSFREEREHLLRRVLQLEHELEILALRLDARQPPSPVEPPADPPPAPSRTPS
jgi:hypothetical protein